MGIIGTAILIIILICATVAAVFFAGPWIIAAVVYISMQLDEKIENTAAAWCEIIDAAKGGRENEK